MATCESCAADEARLIGVHRRYIVPGEWDAEASDRTMPDVEMWCLSCVTTYPNEVADAADTADGADTAGKSE